MLLLLQKHGFDVNEPVKDNPYASFIGAETVVKGMTPLDIVGTLPESRRKRDATAMLRKIGGKTSAELEERAAAAAAADLKGEIDRAVAAYARDVRERRFPAEVETYFSKKPATP